MNTFERFYRNAKANRWYWLFALFCRVSLAIGFIASGMVKILGERFASGLSANHPMGAYLEALHHTGYYYTFIGVAQVIAAILLLIPRTVALGALLYFPIIVNITVLSFAVRFDGSFVSAPLMVLACLYLLFWNYDSLKYILPFKKHENKTIALKPARYSLRFPFGFAAAVIAMIAVVILFFAYGHDVMPRNDFKNCRAQFQQTEYEMIGKEFCECVHKKGEPLDICLGVFETAIP